MIAQEFELKSTQDLNGQIIVTLMLSQNSSESIEESNVNFDVDEPKENRIDSSLKCRNTILWSAPSISTEVLD